VDHDASDHKVSDTRRYMELQIDIFVKPEPQTPKDGPECRQCILTEKVLTDKGVTFNRHVLDDESASILRDRGFGSAPVVLITDLDLREDKSLVDPLGGDGYIGGWAGFQPLRITELAGQVAA
jgi:glutaredoxin